MEVIMNRMKLRSDEIQNKEGSKDKGSKVRLRYYQFITLPSCYNYWQKLPDAIPKSYLSQSESGISEEWPQPQYLNSL